ncbi:MAG: mechanosensitive ion channel [Bacteroidetes bacterium]|nr:mechanosensitive ion channel [Bacteroidota bacterium]
MTIIYFILAFVLFLALRFISRLASSVPAKKNIHKFLLRAFPMVEFVIWLAFGLWIINYFFKENSFYGILVSIAAGSLIILLGWYFLRDFVAGIILKTEIAFEVNQRIKTSQYEGILRKMGYRSIEIESESGEQVKIPYGMITANAIVLQNLDESIHGSETSLRVSALVPVQEMKDRISKEILLLPWSSINHEPIIRLSQQEATFNTFLVHFYSISNKHTSYICQHLKSTFETDTSCQIVKNKV